MVSKSFYKLTIPSKKIKYFVIIITFRVSLLSDPWAQVYSVLLGADGVPGLTNNLCVTLHLFIKAPATSHYYYPRKVSMFKSTTVGPVLMSSGGTATHAARRSASSYPGCSTSLLFMCLQSCRRPEDVGPCHLPGRPRCSSWRWPGPLWPLTEWTNDWKLSAPL